MWFELNWYPFSDLHVWKAFRSDWVTRINTICVDPIRMWWTSNGYNITDRSLRCIIYHWLYKRVGALLIGGLNEKKRLQLRIFKTTTFQLCLEEDLRNWLEFGSAAILWFKITYFVSTVHHPLWMWNVECVVTLNLSVIDGKKSPTAWKRQANVCLRSNANSCLIEFMPFIGCAVNILVARLIVYRGSYRGGLWHGSRKKK